MSKSAAKDALNPMERFKDDPDPLKRLEKDLGMFAPEVPQPSASDLPTRGGPADPEIEKRATVQFANREQEIQRAAVAAGAQRSENDADLLGYAPTRRRGQARRILG